MPIRGENIGTAYVRIIADGDGLDESIRRQFRESEPSVREAGEHNADEYTDAFDKQVRKSYKGNFDETQRDMFKRMNDNLTDSLARLELADRFFKSKGWNEFKDRLENESGEAGRRAGENLERQFRDSGDLDKLADEVRRFGTRTRAAQEEIVRAQEALEREQAAAREKRWQDMVRRERERMDMLYRDALWENRQFDLRAARERELNRLHIIALRMNEEYDKKRRASADKDHNFFLRAGRDIQNLSTRMDRFGDGVGRLFGGGSRNNFLNFFGRLIGSVVKLPGTIIGLFGSISTGIGNLIKKIDADGWVKTLTTGFFSAAAGVVALVAALTALIAILGPVLALINLAVGAILALAGSVAFALVGALGALVSLVPAVAFGIGSVVAAFVGAEHKSGPLHKALEALKGDLHFLSLQAREGLFADLPDQIERLGGVVHRLGPLVKASATGMRLFFGELISGMQSPGFQRFINAFTAVVPGMLRTLGKVISNTLSGIGGIFVALIPVAQRTLGWLEGVTKRFSDWANSFRGRHEIQDFMRRALQSLQSVWDFLVQLGGLFGDFFSTGRVQGDRMFDSLTRKVKEFRRFLAEPVKFKITADDTFARRPDRSGELPQGPSGQQVSRLEGFFADARRFANDLGDAVVAIGDLVDELDDDTARKNLHDILQSVDDITTRVDDMINLFESLFLLLPNGPKPQWLQWISDKAAEVGGKIKDLFHILGGGGSGSGIGGGNGLIIPIHAPDIAGFLDHFKGLGRRVLGAIGLIDVNGNIRLPSLGEIAGHFGGLAARILTQTGIVHLLDAFNFPDLSVIAGRFAGTASRILTQIGHVHLLDAFDFPDLGGIAGRFSGLAGQILSQIGHIDLGSLMHGTIDPPGPLGPWSWARGGIADRAMIRQIGEDGPEAVVPLDRPLNEVDPAVRWLSAIAQGLSPLGAPLSASGGGGKSVTVGQLHVHTPADDPYAVAAETVNRLAAVGY